MNPPRRVVFSEHGAQRCARYDRDQTEVGELVLAGHRRRRRNAGSADWLIVAGGLAIAYDWPDHGDETIAAVVTVWPQR